MHVSHTHPITQTKKGKKMIADNLKKHNIILPQPVPPAAAYVPTRITGNLLYIAGQLPFVDGKLTCVGTVGQSVSVDEAKEAARICAINIMAQIQSALGDLERVTQFVRIGGFVNCVAGFGDQPTILNGASVLIGEIFGPRGQHARVAVGTNALPFNASVEVEALVEFK